MAFNSLGSALSPLNIRDALGQIASNAAFGRWAVVKSNNAENTIDKYSWGYIKKVFLETDAIAVFDSFMSFNLKKQNLVTDYPLEGGGFTSAMKVVRPGEYEVVLVKNGMNLNQSMTKFLDDLNRYRDGMELVDIVTPFKSYIGCSIEAADYAHYKNRYSNMLVVALSIKEIMQGGILRGKTRNPESASMIDTGQSKMSLNEEYWIGGFSPANY